MRETTTDRLNAAAYPVTAPRFFVQRFFVQPQSVDQGLLSFVRWDSSSRSRAGAVATLDDDSSAEWIGCAG